MIKHTDEAIQAMIEKLETLPVDSEEAKTLRSDIAKALIADSRKPKSSDLSLVLMELMASV